MSPLLQEKLIDLLVNFVSIVLGGGLVFLIIEWRRHRRERKKWEEEDNQVAIDIPRCEMRIWKWQINDFTPEDEQLTIYKNNLQNTNKQLLIVSNFVIRNTTPAEIVITSYGAATLNVTSDIQTDHYYDLGTYDFVSREEVGAITLKPFGLISRMFVSAHKANGGNKIDYTPDTLAVEVKTSSGKVIQKKVTINVVSSNFPDMQLHQGFFRPNNYLEKIYIDQKEDDIPF